MTGTFTRVAGLFLAALTLHCSNTPSMSADLAVVADLAGAPADLSVVVDFTPPPDLIPLPPDLVPAVYNGCTDGMFVDQSASAVRTITFPNGNLTYSPKCLLINAAQMVTFSGAFASHPLRPGVGSTATAGSPNNPITATNTGLTMNFTFPAVGDYPYNCAAHDGSGMNGVVRVK